MIPCIISVSNKDTQQQDLFLALYVKIQIRKKVKSVKKGNSIA